ncbi:MAG TPA: LysM peptidoglycan-binding domain-containing protein, partial [Anaerolineae bacterium]|nr:LysM peptidoglycan-binding domain-containing protein [Anaerolineae bacterium]
MMHRKHPLPIVLMLLIPLLAACSRPATPSPATAPLPDLTGGGWNVTATAPPAAPPTVSPTAAVTPSPAYPGLYDTTPTPDPTVAAPTSGLESHIVQPGETLSLIAAVYGCTVEEIVAANGLPNADTISIGQTLYIPVAATADGLYLKLIPDSEMVYGPAYIHFDLPGFVAAQGGYLAGYSEEVEGRTLTGAEIVRLVARRFSVGPRVLLALLELQSQWVTNPHPANLDYPVGYEREYYEGLFTQLSWAAVRLNEGYYGWKRGDHATLRLLDGTRLAVAPGLNAGTVGVQNCLAELSSSREQWLALVGPDGFPAVYGRLFGNPFAYGVEPLLPPGLTQPELRFPWEAGRMWYFTGGPHGGWGNGSGRAALDFVPGDKIHGCLVSQEWAAAAADGLIVYSADGMVLEDLDGDGFEESGWVLLYLHLADRDRVPVGTYVSQGERIGHPSCEGGYAEATHLHFARRYNGEWIPAGRGPLP